MCVCVGGGCCDLACAVALGVKTIFIVRMCVCGGGVVTLFVLWLLV